MKGLKIKAFLVLCLAVFSASAFFCPPALAQSDHLEIKMGTLAPRNIGWAKAWEEILEKGLVEAAGGRVSFKTYYGGIMGDDEDYVMKMRIDQLQAASMTAQGTRVICPEMAVLSLPFILNSYEEVDFIRPKMYPIFDKLFADRGFALIYWFEQDFDQLYSLSKPTDRLATLPRFRFLTWYGVVEEKTLEALNVKPVSINAPEVPSALRQRVIDALIAPAVWVVGSQTYTVIGYANPIKIRYAPGLHVWSSKAFGRLSAEHQAGVLATRNTVLEEFIAFTRNANEQSLAALARYGMKMVEMDPNELEAMKQATRPVWDSLAGELYPKELLDTMLGYLEEFRSMQ
jgi:TRAP-type C4-dicarboxylate transport system substrate-binding protein